MPGTERAARWTWTGSPPSSRSRAGTRGEWMTDTAMEASPALAGTPDEARRKIALYLGMVGGVILLDQLTKMLVLRTLRPYSPVEVLGDFFRLTFIYNTGAAFGLHLGDASRWVFM